MPGRQNNGQITLLLVIGFAMQRYQHAARIMIGEKKALWKKEEDELKKMDAVKKYRIPQKQQNIICTEIKAEYKIKMAEMFRQVMSDQMLFDVVNRRKQTEIKQMLMPSIIEMFHQKDQIQQVDRHSKIKSRQKVQVDGLLIDSEQTQGTKKIKITAEEQPERYQKKDIIFNLLNLDLQKEQKIVMKRKLKIGKTKQESVSIFQKLKRMLIEKGQYLVNPAGSKQIKDKQPTPGETWEVMRDWVIEFVEQVKKVVVIMIKKWKKEGRNEQAEKLLENNEKILGNAWSFFARVPAQYRALLKEQAQGKSEFDYYFKEIRKSLNEHYRIQPIDWDRWARQTKKVIQSHLLVEWEQGLKKRGYTDIADNGKKQNKLKKMGEKQSITLPKRQIPEENEKFDTDTLWTEVWLGEFNKHIEEITEQEGGQIVQQSLDAIKNKQRPWPSCSWHAPWQENIWDWSLGSSESEEEYDGPSLDGPWIKEVQTQNKAGEIQNAGKYIRPKKKQIKSENPTKDRIKIKIEPGCITKRENENDNGKQAENKDIDRMKDRIKIKKEPGYVPKHGKYTGINNNITENQMRINIEKLIQESNEASAKMQAGANKNKLKNEQDVDIGQNMTKTPGGLCYQNIGTGGNRIPTKPHQSACTGSSDTQKTINKKSEKNPSGGTNRENKRTRGENIHQSSQMNAINKKHKTGLGGQMKKQGIGTGTVNTKPIVISSKESTAGAIENSAGANDDQIAFDNFNLHKNAQLKYNNKLREENENNVHMGDNGKQKQAGEKDKEPAEVEIKKDIGRSGSGQTPESEDEKITYRDQPESTDCGSKPLIKIKNYNYEDTDDIDEDES